MPTVSQTNDIDDQYLTLLDDMNALRLENPDSRPIAANVRYFGTSSTAVLLVKAMEVKTMYYPVLTSSQTSREDRYYARNRPEMWMQASWERSVGEIRHGRSFLFPAQDLLPGLVDNYFAQVNIFLPLLHRPTFESALFDGLHLRDEGFASIVLVVCAIGARWSEDPRVYTQGDGLSSHSRGWFWYNQAQDQRLGYLSLPSLYDLQFHTVR